MNLYKLGNSVLLKDIEINGSNPKVFEFNYELTKEAQQEIVIKYNFGKDVYSLLSGSGDLSVIPNTFKTLLQLVKLYKKYNADLLNVKRDDYSWSAQLRGWCQYRKLIPNEIYKAKSDLNFRSLCL